MLRQPLRILQHLHFHILEIDLDMSTHVSELFQVLRILGVQMAIFGTHSCLSKFLPFMYLKKEKTKNKNEKQKKFLSE